MWKDEQFGLTFMNVMNRLEHPSGFNDLIGDESGSKDGADKKSTFSLRGLVLVHVFTWCGAMSTYNVLVELARFIGSDTLRDFQYSFNELVPCLFVHPMLVLYSAVIR